MAITVDATLSTSSTNPVQNKAITLELNNKADSSSLPHGVPSGGTTGQVLVKSSNSDYAVEWQTITTPSGTKNISITSNGTTTEDVTNYATASITTNVPASAVDSGTKNISITQNGTTTENVVGYANASISVNVSSGMTIAPMDYPVMIKNGRASGTTVCYRVTYNSTSILSAASQSLTAGSTGTYNDMATDGTHIWISPNSGSGITYNGEEADYVVSSRRYMITIPAGFDGTIPFVFY